MKYLSDLKQSQILTKLLPVAERVLLVGQLDAALVVVGAERARSAGEVLNATLGGSGN